MTSGGNILTFPTGIPLGQDLDQIDQELQGDDENLPLVSEEQKRNLLARIDRLRLLVQQDRIEAFCLVGQDPVTGYFVTEVCLDPHASRTELFGFVGVIETLKLELSEHASMAPFMDLDGGISDPYFEASE
jgi:hypothetical protein